MEEPSRDESYPYSYDFHVITENTKENHSAKQFRIERKTFPDLKRSLVDRKLDRQCSYVDILLVEIDPFDLVIPPPQRQDETDSDYDARIETWERTNRNACKHLAKLACNMPVWWSSGPEMTMELLRYLERYRNRMQIRENDIQMNRYRSNYKYRILAALPFVMPFKVPEKRDESMGEILSKHVDWEALIKALNLEEWTKEDMGRQSIRHGKASSIQEKILESDEDGV